MWSSPPRILPRLVALLALGCAPAPTELPPADGGPSGPDARAADAAPPDAARPSGDGGEAHDAGGEVADGGPRSCAAGDAPVVVAVGPERAHGDSLRIEGCRFGSKARPEPALFDTVDGVAAYAGLGAGDVIPTDGSAPWTRNGSPWATEMRLATESPRGHRRAFYRAAGGGHGGDGFLGWPRALGGTRPPADQLVLYVSWWYRPSMDPGGGDPPGANKFIRVWDNDGSERSYVSWTHMHIGYSGGEHSGWRSWTEDGRVGEWNRMEIAVDARRGTVRHYVNGVYQRVSHSSVGSFDIDDFQKRPEFSDLGLTVAVLGFDHGLTSYGAMVTDIGEIYVDTTRARVEIGDAPRWSDTRHREIQLPAVWVDDAIEVTLDEGSFDSLRGRWLYVVDEDGAVNEEGFPL